MGYTRMNGEIQNPEFTPAIVLLLEYGIAHEAQCRTWIATGKKDIIEPKKEDEI